MKDEDALIRGIWLIAQSSRNKQIDEKIFNNYEEKELIKIMNIIKLLKIYNLK